MIPTIHGFVKWIGDPPDWMLLMIKILEIVIFWNRGNHHSSIISPFRIQGFRPLAQDLPKDQDGYPYEPTASVIKDVASFLVLWWVFEY